MSDNRRIGRRAPLASDELAAIERVETEYQQIQAQRAARGHREQPAPVHNDHASIQSLVRADLVVREQVGIQRYGTSLQPHNGRDALRDAYEEALDLCCYLKQVMVERDGPQ